MRQKFNAPSQPFFILSFFLMGFSMSAHAGDGLLSISEARALAHRNATAGPPCLLAVGLSPSGSPGRVDPKVICLSEVVKAKDSIDEDLGCSMVLYDLKARAYSAGANNLRIATNKSCNGGGLEAMNAKPFVEFATDKKKQDHVLLSAEARYASWWKRLVEDSRRDIRGQAELKERCSKKVTLRSAPGKDWVFDPKTQIEPEKAHAIVREQYTDASPECLDYRKRHSN